MIDKNELIDGLNLLRPAITNSDNLISYMSFAFENGMMCAGLHGIQYMVKVDGIDFDASINALELLEFLKKSKAKEVSMVKKGDEILVESGRAKAGFSVLKWEGRTPFSDSLKTLKRWKKIPDGFLDALSMAIPVVGKGLTVVNSVSFNSNGYIDATDNYRISRQKVEIPDLLLGKHINAELLKDVVKLKPTHITEDKTKTSFIAFKNEKEDVIIVSVNDGSFVDVDKVFGKVSFDGESITFPEVLIPVLDKAAVFSKDFDMDNKVDITVTSEEITVSARSDTAWFKEVVLFEGHSGTKGKQPFVFSITPYLLSNILKHTLTAYFTGSLVAFEYGNSMYVTSIQIEK